MAPDDTTAGVPEDDGSLAPKELFEQLYDELRAVARRYMGTERPNHTLQPTALVNEAFIRLAKANPAVIKDRVHFLRLAARTMRRVLVDYARAAETARRGGFMTRVTLSDDASAVSPRYDIIDVDRALEELATLHPRQADILELRYIVGLTVEEAAIELRVSPKTVKNDTRVAMAWLRRELE
jgi:RNA polymerase sigma factor (TIGR02999 family)